MSHTKGPWSINRRYSVSIRANSGKKHIGNTDSLGDSEENIANAARIVACVNACDGITTDSLIQGGFGSILSLGLADQERFDDLLASVEHVKHKLMSNRLSGIGTLQIWRKAAVSAESDIEDILAMMKGGA